MKKNKDKLKKRIYNIIPIVVLVSILIIIYISFRIYNSPYSTESRKELKPICKATMKGISDFRISAIWIMEEKSYVEIDLRLKGDIGPKSFTEEELYSINLATEQLIQYMNSNSEDYPYNKYGLKFQIGVIPTYIHCTVEKQGKEFAFVNLGDNATGLLITDLYMMKDVQMISIGGGSTMVFEDEKVNKFSELHKLEKINFGIGLNQERVNEFAKFMKGINPDCKVFFGEEEIVVSD